MWRFDANRSASSPDPLPVDLQLAWTKTLSARTPTWDDVLNNDLMQFDRQFEPIVVGDRVYVGFNDTDKVVCWELATGQENWRYYTDGPVRLPLAGRNDAIYAVSDDGFLHCIEASSGMARWKVRGGPSAQKVYGNRRIVSMWPARGGPAVRDGQVYFAASIWPFLGTFVYSVDAASGEIAWVNDGTSASYIKQPHSAPSFAGVAPQGAIAVTEQHVVVPGGRSVPAVFDRADGAFVHFHLNAGGKGTGGATVMATEDHFYVHTRNRGVRQMEMVSGNKTALLLDEPVLDGDFLITSNASSIRSVRADAPTTDQGVVWQLPVDGSGDLIQAGGRIYAAGNKAITVIEVAPDQRSARVIKQFPVLGRVCRLIAGGDALLAVTLEGSIYCYRSATSIVHSTEERFAQHASSPPAILAPSPSPMVTQPMASILQQHSATSGLALVYGVENNELLERLIAVSELQITAVSPDANVVNQLRREYDERGLYGTRITVHHGTATDFHAPQYVAHVVVYAGSDGQCDAVDLQAMYASVRPYGGILWMANATDPAPTKHAMATIPLPRATLTPVPAGVCITRAGSLEGSAPWTHQYGNVSNTVKSDDQLVKPPLGILWFGGNSHHDVLPRHGHSPGEQVIDGRLIVEGMNSLSARDVYTGRLLWRREFADLGTKGIYFDDTYEETPLSTKYNQVHIPGANARGTNFVVTHEEYYLVIDDYCLVLDPRTGETLRQITLPRDPDRAPTEEVVEVLVSDNAVSTDREQEIDTGTSSQRLHQENGAVELVAPRSDDDHATEDGRRWTYLGVHQDMLLAGIDFLEHEAPSALFAEVQALAKRGPAWSPQWLGSKEFTVLDRNTGTARWRMKARHSFLHNGIVAGGDSVFLIDKLPKSLEAHRARRGRGVPNDYRLMAVNAKSGELVWQTQDRIAGTWLGYSAEHDILILAGSAGPDRAIDESGVGIVAYRAQTGERLWEHSGLEYTGPCIIHHDQLITNSRSYAPTSGVLNLLDGTPILITNPLTGIDEPWTYRRAYGCNTAVACEHMLTFRSGAASFYDLSAKSGVVNLGGFRSGCTSNLIAADGVLNAPDFTRTCTCGYQNQTSLALIHMPDVEMWTVNPFDSPHRSSPIRQVGINFGAAGSRIDEEGLMWIEHPPSVENVSPVRVEAIGDNVRYVRRHSSVASGSIPWVLASGLVNASNVVLDLVPALLPPEIAEATSPPATTTLPTTRPPANAQPVASQHESSATTRPATSSTQAAVPTEPASHVRPQVTVDATDATRYSVDLHFVADDRNASAPVDVWMQDRLVLSQFDLAAESPQAWQGIVRTIKQVVPRDGRIHISFRVAEGNSVPTVAGIVLRGEHN